MSKQLPFFYLFILLVCTVNISFSQTYPPQQQLVFDQMPIVPKPGYLVPMTDPTFGSTVIRVSDQAVFNTHSNGMTTVHQYAKSSPWNSDGTMIKLAGWSNAILDAQTYQVKYVTWLPGGHTTWSNTQPNIIYGTNHPNYDGNCIAQNDVTTNTTSLIFCFNEYDYVSYGEGEGNMSNDDRYMAIQCRKPGGAMEVAVFDFVTNSKVASMPAPVWPNNVAMTQSGDYVTVQWDVHGTGPAQGTWAYNRNDLSPVRNLSPLGGSHFDYCYDTQGNEVMVGPNGVDRGIRMVRIDNGAETSLIGDDKMSWYIHVSCRNLSRPGWAYYTEFANVNSQTWKPNYQKVFSVQLDPNANNNALTETFAHVQHSTNVSYHRSPFGVPSRDGSKVMFRSDWGGNSSSEINSYVAFMPTTAPDLTPVVTVAPANISGVSNVGVAIRINEVNQINSDGSDIRVRIPIDQRIVFSWDPSLTAVAFNQVENSKWSYAMTPLFHEFTFPFTLNAGLNSAFGFNAVYDPQNTSGQTTITATVVPLTGGEDNPANNSDSEMLIYFF